jgi:hypothetical protein
MHTFYSFVAKSGLCIHVTYVNPALVPSPLKKFTVYMTPDASERSLARMAPLHMQAMIIEDEAKRVVCQFANAPMLTLRFSYELIDQSFEHEGTMRSYREPGPLPIGTAETYATHACYTVDAPNADGASKEFVLRRVEPIEIVA